MNITITCTHGALQGTSFVFGTDDLPLRIGRHPSCEIAFDPHEDLRASSFHAELQLVNQQVVLVDSGSTNGTLLNEQPLAAATPLATGDLMTFGLGGPQLRIHFEGQLQDENAPLRDETTKPFPTPPPSE